MGTPREQILAEWEAIQRTPGWAEYTVRIQKMLDASMAGLKKNSEYARVLQLQGEVAALERILGVPREMLKELVKINK